MLKTWQISLLLLAVMAIGLIPRLATYQHWSANEEVFFLPGEERVPLLLAADGYHFLDLARSLAEGSYEPFDPDRRVPQGYERPQPPPLFSVFLAHTHTITGVPLERIGSFYAPLAGVLLAIPMYFLGTLLGKNVAFPRRSPAVNQTSAQIMGLIAAAFALLSPAYVARSSFAWVDTDPVILTLVICAILFAYGAAISESVRARLLHLLGWLLTFVIFLWWWQVPKIVFAITGAPLAIALLVALYRAPRQAPWIAAAAIAGLIGFSLVFDASFLRPDQLGNTVSAFLGYLTSSEPDDMFFPVADFITELRPASLQSFAIGTTGHFSILALAAVGLLGLILTLRIHALFLLPLIVLSGLSVIGVRFIYFFAPLLGLGFGFLALLAWRLLHSWPSRTFASLAFLSAGGFMIIALTNTIDRFNPALNPATNALHIDGMAELAHITSPDAVIWTYDWSHGYALRYYSRRGIINDGGFHPSEVNYVQSFPFTSTSSRQAANWMQFYVAHGQPGLRRANLTFGDHAGDWAQGIPALQALHALGPEAAATDKRIASRPETEREELLAFLFPALDRPVYVFLDSGWKRRPWFSVGANPFTGQNWQELEYNYLPITDLFTSKDRRLISGSSGLGILTVDPASGTLTIDGVEIGATESIFIRQLNDMLVQIPFNRESDLFINLNIPGRVGVMADLRMQESLMTRLYYQEYDVDGFFEQIQSRMPYHSTWRVRPDVWGRIDGSQTPDHERPSRVDE